MDWTSWCQLQTWDKLHRYLFRYLPMPQQCDKCKLEISKFMITILDRIKEIVVGLNADFIKEQWCAKQAKILGFVIFKKIRKY